MLHLRPSPVHVSAAAAKKLPRLALLTLLAAYILPGLWGRTLWNPAQIAAFAEMRECIEAGLSGALFPMIQGTVITDHGPLAGWVGAAIMKLLSGVASPLALAHLTSALWFALTAASLWYGTWFLARRAESQPVFGVFNNHASYRDYGRLVADAATLFFLSLFGLVLSNHEATYLTATQGLCALTYFACAWSMTRPYAGAALSGAACGLLMLTASFLTGLFTLLAATLTQVALETLGHKNRKILVTVLVATLVFLLWPLACLTFAHPVAADYFALWAEGQVAHLGLINTKELSRLAELILWYLCPVWPFAALGLIRWKKKLLSPATALPMVFLFASLASFFVTKNVDAEELLAPAVVPLCALAAFGLMGAGRSFQRLLDAFAIGVFSIALLALWAYWGAWVSGTPEKMAASALRLSPAFHPADSVGWPLVPALVAFLFWVWCVWDRTSKVHLALWSGPWLSAVGMSAVWLTVVSLFLGGINLSRSYSPVTQGLAEAVAQEGFDAKSDCLYTEGLSAGLASLISYRTGFALSALDETGRCRLTLVRTSSEKVSASEGKEKPLAVFSRLTNTDERFVLTR